MFTGSLVLCLKMEEEEQEQEEKVDQQIYIFRSYFLCHTISSTPPFFVTSSFVGLHKSTLWIDSYDSLDTNFVY